MAKIKIGQIALETFSVGIIALILLWILSAIITAIAPSFGTWNAVLMMFLSAGLLIFAIYIRPGNENFVETIPIIMIALAWLSVVKMYIPSLPNLGVEFSWTSLAFGLSAVYFADVLYKKALKQIL